MGVYRTIIIPTCNFLCGIGKNGMKRLTSQLRNRDFDTFLKFVECILRAGSENPKINLSIVESIQRAIANFDERNGTSHASLVLRLKEQCVTEPVVSLPRESFKKVDDESNENDERQASADLHDIPHEISLVGTQLGRLLDCGFQCLLLIYQFCVQV